ncbi:DUF1330 domain-containing protein [Polymorphobacter multimanifer]|uniref:Uncharacterized protein (DUF1330 family) n=1 Tax=Polymorphobacter multimanifer TaxID=1070431 RepID=A0A841LF77_9SPHN|nr:DUF1330 domain-containing protein [Polymorphobacter multimanifer]MBB6228465.1 uncharacterized protein (DUF1330 family) [Polymorphobacter multimanifer]GGI80566.1 DUF1330 domain-containing protein [Polymorphobacter multimanifer]
MRVDNAVMPTPEQAAAFFGAEDQGPLVMVNLLRFREHAAYPDGSEPELSGRDAYLRYGAAVEACIGLVGGRALFSGPVTGMLLGEVEAPWDMVALVWYPSPKAMLEMVGLPEYRGIEVHRLAGLEGQLNIRTAPGRMAL